MMAKIEWYEEILALEPGSKVFFPFAKRLAEDGLHDKALAVLRHGLVQHPEYLEARVFLTHLLFSIGNTESAMAEAQLVFGRLAPFPAFWEALSLAHEAMPGDMSLVMRFMAEALRTPGLTVAATMRRGLAPQVSEPAPAPLPLVETQPVVDPMTSAEATDAVTPVESLAQVETLSQVETLPEVEMAPELETLPEVEALPEVEPELPAAEPDSSFFSEPEPIAEEGPMSEGEAEPQDSAEPEAVEPQTVESEASALLSPEELELLAPVDSVTSASEAVSPETQESMQIQEPMECDAAAENPLESDLENSSEIEPAAEPFASSAESADLPEPFAAEPVGSLDPLEPVVDEEDVQQEGVQQEDAPAAESSYTGSIHAEALLPLDDDEVPLLPDAAVESETEPAASVQAENAETVLADAASVDEALAELDGGQTDDVDAEVTATDENPEPDETVTVAPVVEELPQLSVEDLDELDKTVFGEADESADGGEVVAADELEDDLSDLPSLEELAELADMADENPLLAAAAEADDNLPVDIEPKFEMDASSDEAESATSTPDTSATDDASEPAGAPSFYLDGGLLDLDIDGSSEADITESVETESADMAAESVVPEPEQGSGEAEEDAFALAEDALEPVEEALESEDEAVAATEVAAFAEDVQEPVDMTLDTEEASLPPAEAVQEVEHEPLEFVADPLTPVQESPASGENMGFEEEALDLDEPVELSPEALALMQSALGIGDAPEQKTEEPEQEAAEPTQEPVELVEKVEAPELPSAVHVQIQPANVSDEADESILELTDAVDAEESLESEDVAESESGDGDMTDDAPLRTRSMADVLAEQGDIDGALAIYEDLLHRASPEEAASLGKRIDSLKGQKTAEKLDPKASSKSDKAGLRSMLENLAGRLEKRAKS